MHKNAGTWDSRGGNDTHTKHHLCERALRLNAKLNEVYRISVYTLWSLSKVS